MEYRAAFLAGMETMRQLIAQNRYSDPKTSTADMLLDDLRKLIAGYEKIEDSKPR
jgi:hypothetical protein